MKIEHITALKDAGFTAEQIVALAPLLDDEKSAAPAEPQKPEPPAEPQKPEPPAEPEKTPVDEMLSAMQKQFTDMMKAVQGAMINTSRQDEQTMTAADVAASILDPGRNRGKK